VLVITAAHSRFITARMIPTRKTEDLLLGSWEVITQLGRVPRRLIWDNEPEIGRGARRAEGVAAFMGTLATRLVLLPPRDPESKRIVERRNGWFETSFMPGRAFISPADFNEQFRDWLTRANARVLRTIAAAPLDRLDADRAAMLPLPPVVLHLDWRNRVRLGRDYYVRLDTSDYSVDPAAIGRLVEVSGGVEAFGRRHDGYRLRVTPVGKISVAHPTPPNQWAERKFRVGDTSHDPHVAAVWDSDRSTGVVRGSEPNDQPLDHVLNHVLCRGPITG
jgi:hypothetical protein